MSIMKMKIRRKWCVVLCLLCLVQALIGCGSSGRADMETTANNQTEESVSSSSTAQVSENIDTNATGTEKKIGKR